MRAFPNRRHVLLPLRLAQADNAGVAPANAVCA